MKKKLWSYLSTAFIILTFLSGAGLLLYPTVSNWWNVRHSSKLIDGYEQSVNLLSQQEEDTILQSARAYNEFLFGNPLRFKPTQRETDIYMSNLNISKNGIMGNLSIPSLDINIPIYHTTDESVMQVGIGHMEGSSLPVGGENTHCVLSGHTGLASAKLLTNLKDMEVGETFTLSVLSKNLTYEVDAINIVLPDDLSLIDIEKGKDYCTILTCTPYGLNTHRLLVRGKRIETPEIVTDQIKQTKSNFEKQEIGLWIILIVLCLFLVIVLIVYFHKQCR